METWKNMAGNHKIRLNWTKILKTICNWERFKYKPLRTRNNNKMRSAVVSRARMMKHHWGNVNYFLIWNKWGSSLRISPITPCSRISWAIKAHTICCKRRWLIIYRACSWACRARMPTCRRRGRASKHRFVNSSQILNGGPSMVANRRWLHVIG